MGGHARYSPSSGKRRLECPPSLLLEEQFPDEESPFAAEGTAGHAMAEYLINKYLKKKNQKDLYLITKISRNWRNYICKVHYSTAYVVFTYP